MKRTKKELKTEGFICTDGSERTEQWVKKLYTGRFLIYERYHDVMNEIKLSDYSRSQLEHYISGYYKSLEEISELYGDDADQIIAECISEMSIS